MGDEFNAGKYGAVVPLFFGVANAVTNQTNTDIAEASAAAHSLIVAPKSGSVVGIGVSASASVSAGSATFRAHKDGTEFAQSGYPAPVLNATNAAKTYATARPNALTFSAGDGLGVSYTSTTDLAPTNTNDFAVVLYVQFDPN